jgi:hypothetical protein
MIVAACDRKISFFGGLTSADGIAVKMTGINRDWTVMFAGPLSPMVALTQSIAKRVEHERPMEFLPFARLCRDVYREERKPLIESDVLANYDVETYSEYLALRKSDLEFHAKITEEIKKVEEEWNLLFAGFDKRGKAHIFTVTENGKINFCDKEGYAAIGSGSLRALISLSDYPFSRRLGLSEAVFGVAAAKFAAESADGVGKETMMSILQANAKTSPVFSDHGIETLRKMWRNLPRRPVEATRSIWQEITKFQQLGWLNNPKRPSRPRKSAGR